MWQGGTRATAGTAVAVVCTAGVLLAGGSAYATAGPAKQASPATSTAGFQDQFTGTKLDLTKWQYFPSQGCVSPSNAKVSGGYLHLITTKGNCGARIGTRQTFQYGTVSASINFDLVQGAHTGLTMFGASGKWPWNGEVDIAEQIGRRPNTDSVRVWTQNLFATSAKRCGTSFNLPATVNQQWHTYGIVWQPGSITFSLDGKTIWYWASWEAAASGCSYPFDDPGYQARVYLTSSVGGTYAGPPPANHAGYPLDTLVDYLTITPPAPTAKASSAITGPGRR